MSKFVGICRAIYDYSPQTSDELQVADGDVLYVLEKGQDGWWKVKMKVEDDDDGPTGLVPESYIEHVSLTYILNSCDNIVKFNF
jgi:hypothetical protein